MTLLEIDCDNCGSVTGTAGDVPDYCGNCGCRISENPDDSKRAGDQRSTDGAEDVIDTYLSDRAVEYSQDHIGKDIQIGAMVIPPVPREKVEQTVEEYEGAPDDTFDNPVMGHLYDLTDIALAVNHAGDPMLDQSVEDDEESYRVTDDTVAEIKIARGALMSCFNRELAALADRLGLDSEQEDLCTAIREEVGYSVDVDVEEDWDTASEDDLREALGLDAEE